MEIIYSKKAIKDLEFWSKSGNKIILKKIAELIRAIQINPYQGIGKPEPLKHQLSGFWSRRIDTEHSIIYEIIDENIIDILSIISLKGHY